MFCRAFLNRLRSLRELFMVHDEADADVVEALVRQIGRTRGDVDLAG